MSPQGGTARGPQKHVCMVGAHDGIGAVCVGQILAPKTAPQTQAVSQAKGLHVDLDVVVLGSIADNDGAVVVRPPAIFTTPDLLLAVLRDAESFGHVHRSCAKPAMLRERQEPR